MRCQIKFEQQGRNSVRKGFVVNLKSNEEERINSLAEEDLVLFNIGKYENF